MEINSKKNIYFFVIHALVTFASVKSSLVGLAWGVVVLGYGFYQILKNSNANNEAACFAAYFMSLEVVLRVNKGSLSYEMGKYGVIFLLLCGLIFQKKPHFIPRQYLIFLVLLVPALTMVEFPTIDEARKAILFNLSGPICLAVSAMYFYKRPVNKEGLFRMLVYMMLPIFSLGIILFFKTPDLSTVKFSTESNAALSGGFGPNQVSTILGLGIFIGAFAFLSGFSLTGFKIIDIGIVLFLSLRGLLTFSRGGIVAAILGLAAALFFILKYKQDKKLMMQIVVGGFAVGIAGLFIWNYTNEVTGGTLALRYQGRSANDPNKVQFTSGRIDIIEHELEAFGKYPILGTGVGMGKIFRVSQGGKDLAAHTEYTRLIAEHGIYGVFALLILLFTPLAHFFGLNKETKYLMTSFMIIALFTMFHGAMRLAMPGFIYGFALINLTFESTRQRPKTKFPEYIPPAHAQLANV